MLLHKYKKIVYFSKQILPIRFFPIAQLFFANFYVFLVTW